MGWPSLLVFGTLFVSAGLFGLRAMRRGELSGKGRGLKNAFRVAWSALTAFLAIAAILIAFWATWSEGQRVFAGVVTGICLLYPAVLFRHAFGEKRRM